MTRMSPAAAGRTARHVLHAIALAAFVEIAIRTVTLPRLGRVLGVNVELAEQEPPTTLSEPRRLDPDAAARYRTAQRVLRVWPWGHRGPCLRLALIGGSLLRARSPELHLGVARIQGRVVAHAWLTVDDVHLDPTADRYTPLLERTR